MVTTNLIHYHLMGNVIIRRLMPYSYGGRSLLSRSQKVCMIIELFVFRAEWFLFNARELKTAQQASPSRREEY